MFTKKKHLSEADLTELREMKRTVRYQQFRCLILKAALPRFPNGKKLLEQELTFMNLMEEEFKGVVAGKLESTGVEKGRFASIDMATGAITEESIIQKGDTFEVTPQHE